MVRLQKRFAYKYKDKEHYKHVVTIPEEFVDKLGWKEGEEIEPAIKDDQLIFTKSKGRKSASFK